MNNRLNILNIWVDPVDRKEAISRVRKFLERVKGPIRFLLQTRKKIFLFQKIPTLYETFKNADLLLPDGIGIVWAARLLFGARLERVPGSEFIFDICELAVKEGSGIFIYGAKENTNKSCR